MDYQVQESDIQYHNTSSPGGLKCFECHKTFKVDKDLKRHQRRVHAGKTFKCNVCGFIAARKDSLKRHVELKHREGTAIRNRSSHQTLNRQRVHHQSSGAPLPSYVNPSQNVRNCGGVSSSVQQTSDCSKKFGGEKVIYGKARDINKQESKIVLNKCNRR